MIDNNMKKEVLDYTEKAEKFLKAADESVLTLEYLDRQWEIVFSAGNVNDLYTIKQYAKSLASSFINEEKVRCTDIKIMYKELMNVKSNNKYVKDMKNKIESIYSKYEVIYDELVIQEVPSNQEIIGKYKNDINDLKNIINKAKKEYGKNDIKSK